MARYITSLNLPDVVYHGTTMGAVDMMKQKIINFDFLKESRQRDFGTGFYTTIDLRQAMSWPIGKLVNKIDNGAEAITKQVIPAVIKIRIVPSLYDDDIDVLDFRGESMEWVKFVLNHRYDSSIDGCSCQSTYQIPHSQIVCGSMADNDTGDLINEFILSGRNKDNPVDIDWFGRGITRSKDGKRMRGLELGDQIAFFDERLNHILKFEGYYKLDLKQFSGRVNDSTNYKKEWEYYDENNRPAHDE